MRIRIDITGKRFGKLVAQYPVRSPKTVNCSGIASVIVEG